MRQSRVLAPPRRVPVRLPAPVLMPRPPAPAPRPPAPPVLRREPPAPALRPPAIILTLRQPAIVLALRESVIALVPRWPTVTLTDMARPASAVAGAVGSAMGATLRGPSALLSAALARGVLLLKLAAVALVIGIVALAIMNNRHGRPISSGGFELASLPSNETVVFRKPSSVPADDADAAADQGEQPVSYYQRAIQTIRFFNPNPRVQLASAIPESPRGLVKVHGFTVFTPRDAAVETDANESILRRRKLGGIVLNEVDDYLWDVYQRQPLKRDSTGDFTWKDPAAANRMGLSVEDYVIGGMDPAFREKLFQAGRAMDADGIQWSMLSAFRDDYRQSLASGFKARTGNSLHGGSRRTGGYGHGRAIDITVAEGDAEVVWKWLDQHGSKYGLARPMPGADPAHIQEAGEWHKGSAAMRSARTKAVAAAHNRHKRSKVKFARAK
jgi:hypothetical protein